MKTLHVSVSSTIKGKEELLEKIGQLGALVKSINEHELAVEIITNSNGASHTVSDDVYRLAQEHAIYKQVFEDMLHHDELTRRLGDKSGLPSLQDHVKITVFDAQMCLRRLERGISYFDRAIADVYVNLRAFPVPESKSNAGSAGAG